MEYTMTLRKLENKDPLEHGLIQGDWDSVTKRQWLSH